MDSLEKARILSERLKKDVLPLIEQDYVFYGLPYHSNIGDTLIWEGELALLSHSSHKCKSACGWNDYPGKKIPPGECMLLHGGGYFGDVWRDAWELSLNEIALNNDRRIIILPISIWYQDPKYLESDRQLLSKARKLTILVRDRQSYDIAVKYFDNDVRLVPDIAFAVEPDSLKRWAVSPDKECLYLKRIDKEAAPSGVVIPSCAQVEDWPTISSFTKQERLVYTVNSYYKRWKGVPGLSSFLKSLNDSAYHHIYRKQMLSRGVQFISQYQTVYTTRLHGMILAALLGKQVFFVDNNYGKISSFYQTWLSDVDSINPATNA